MKKRSKTRADADGGWKDIIEDFTEEFFEFYFPDVHAAVDFTEPVKFLDKELREIVTESEVAGREADKLIEVRLKAAPSGSWSMSRCRAIRTRDSRRGCSSTTTGCTTATGATLSALPS